MHAQEDMTLDMTHANALQHVCLLLSPTLPTTCELPSPSLLTSRFVHLSFETTDVNHGKISYHGWIAKTFVWTTTCNLPNTFFPLDLTRILAHCRWLLSTIFLSLPWNLYKHHQCSWKLFSPQMQWQLNHSHPNLSCLEQPTFGLYQSTYNFFPSYNLFPNAIPFWLQNRFQT